MRVLIWNFNMRRKRRRVSAEKQANEIKKAQIIQEERKKELEKLSLESSSQATTPSYVNNNVDVDIDFPDNIQNINGKAAKRNPYKNDISKKEISTSESDSIHVSNEKSKLLDKPSINSKTTLNEAAGVVAYNSNQPLIDGMEVQIKQKELILRGDYVETEVRILEK
jgi:hypothetical protein